jgi:tetratricopeptide (TPR) repeat protein
MTKLERSLLFVGVLGPALLLGCATGTTYLEMSRTAGFVGALPGKMYVEHIGGEDSSAFRDQLYGALSEEGRFATQRYGIAPPEEPDSASKIPAIILSGTHRSYKNTRYFSERSGEDERKYKEVTDTHEFRYLIRDAVTGEELDASVASHHNVEKEIDRGESFLEEVVGGILKGAADDLLGVESRHREELIRIFVASLYLHPVRRVVGLLEDKDIPELKEGIDLVRKRDWPAAIAKFQAGAEGHPNSPSLHKAYFNLGVAFEYSHEFERALTSLRLADELAPQEKYAAEIDHCEWFARQYRWQQRYAGL